MSWAINIVGLPQEVIEQLHNLPVPHGQTLGGIGQFNAARSALIVQATAARDNGIPGWAELVKASACGHVNTDGSGSMHVDLGFGFKTPLDSLAPVEVPEEKVPEEKVPEAPEAPEEDAPAPSIPETVVLVDQSVPVVTPADTSVPAAVAALS